MAADKPSSFDFAALVRTATTVHPDHALLSLIETYTRERDRRDDLFRRACRHPERSRRRETLWREMMVGHADFEAMEARVAAMPAKTPDGVQAKLELAVHHIAGDGTRPVGTINALPLAALRDAMALLDG